MVLSCHGLSTGFNKQIVLENISATFKADHLSFILGGNGCGKSLLLHSLAGLHPLWHGKIDYQHITSANLQQDLRKANLKPPSLFQQSPFILARTALQNLLFVMRTEHHQPSHLWRDLAEEALCKVGLENHRHHPADRLSLGQQKLLGFAQILLLKRKVWLLDEPTAMLSPLGRDRVESLIMEQKQQGHKMIIVTHETAQIKQMAASHAQDDILFLCYHDKKPQSYQQSVKDFFEKPPCKEAEIFVNYSLKF